MQLGKVIGNVIAAQKVENTKSLPLLVVQLLNENLKDTGYTIACTDTVQARFGDIVLTCGSSSSRKTDKTKKACTDNTIVAIVDKITMQKQ